MEEDAQKKKMEVLNLVCITGEIHTDLASPGVSDENNRCETKRSTCKLPISHM
jgi:hypothetical protein